MCLNKLDALYLERGRPDPRRQGGSRRGWAQQRRRRRAGRPWPCCPGAASCCSGRRRWPGRGTASLPDCHYHCCSCGGWWPPRLPHPSHTIQIRQWRSLSRANNTIPVHPKQTALLLWHQNNKAHGITFTNTRSGCSLAARSRHKRCPN